MTQGSPDADQAVRAIPRYAAALLVCGVGLTMGMAAVIDEPFGMSWWWVAIAVLFALTELRYVPLPFRSDSQTSSLNELPLVGSFYLLSPLATVAASVTGYTAALVLKDKQRGDKLAVNVGHNLLGAAAATLIFHGLSAGSTQARSWIAALIATVVASAINVTAVVIAVRLSRGGMERDREIAPIYGTALAQTLTTTSLALVAMIMLSREPTAAVLLAIPASMLMLAFRAYTREKAKHQSLEFLYTSTRILHESPEIDSAIHSLLVELTRTFRSDVAEVTLLPSERDGEHLRSSVAPDRPSAAMATLDLDEAERRFLESVELLRGGTIATADDDTPLGSYLRARGLRDGMVAALRGETRLLGVLLVADRARYTLPYDDEEQRLFVALAGNASVGLENTHLERTLSELRMLKDELRHQAEHDALTGLANRALFTEKVEAAVEDRRSGRIGVLYLDLDDFKTVNDTLGHSAGDQLLVHVASRIRHCLRPADMAARLGGDEFAVLLTELPDAQTAMQVAERILSSLRFPVGIEGRELFVRTSIGIAVRDDDASANELIRRADVAMYEAKHTTKGRFTLYHDRMNRHVEERLALRDALLRGVRDHEFRVHYQPLIDLRSGGVVGVEALVRWWRPDGQVVSPDAFIALAEETGLVLPIGERVLRETAEQVATWQRTISPYLVGTVNLSARQLRHEGLPGLVRQVIEESGLRPGSLVLEITERDVMDDTEVSLERLHELREAGVKLAIDDFGTGYSSLAYLQRFPFDIVKIAKEFVDGIGPLGDGGVLARAIIELSSALSLATIAEGIETREQHHTLRSWNCSVGQGWLFAKALPADEVTTLIEESVTAPPLRLASRPVTPAASQEL